MTESKSQLQNAAEWPGTLMGISNIITKTKFNTSRINKTADNTPQLVEKLITRAKKQMDNNVHINDVIIHGIKVRTYTNSFHLTDFMHDNWFSVQEWRKATGQVPPEKPRVNLYAFCGIPDEEEAAYYSDKHDTVIFFNTAYYGQVKSWLLGAVGKVLAEEFGIHSIHGSAIQKNGKGVLYIAASGTGKSTATYGLMDVPGTRFHSDDWVYVRYCIRTKDGEYVLPIEITGRAKGYSVYKWLEENKASPQKAKVLSLDNRILEVDTNQLDLDEPVKAFAFISEKTSYIRTDIVESFPQYTYNVINARLENVPDYENKAYEEKKEAIDSMCQTALESQNSAKLRQLGPDKLKEFITRLVTFKNSRAILDAVQVFGKDRIFTNPLEPIEINNVILLKRNFNEYKILESLDVDTFCSRLIVGLAPDGTKEIAYNAYRAVDDHAEAAYANELGDGDKVYSAHIDKTNSGGSCPESFRIEFELFRILHSAARCYSLNTILQKRINTKRQAVLATMKIIRKTIEKLPKFANLTLDNFQDYINGVK